MTTSDLARSRSRPERGRDDRGRLHLPDVSTRTLLAGCGLTARRLSGPEIAQLFHACWCPELARVQRLRRALDEYTALVVTGSTPSGGDAPCSD